MINKCITVEKRAYMAYDNEFTLMQCTDVDAVNADKGGPDFLGLGDPGFSLHGPAWLTTKNAQIQLNMTNFSTQICQTHFLSDSELEWLSLMFELPFAPGYTSFV